MIIRCGLLVAAGRCFFHPDEVERTIPYIEDNPVKMRLPRQRWPFVVPYDRWPLHEGHSPNSPYAKALREAGRYP